MRRFKNNDERLTELDRRLRTLEQYLRLHPVGKELTTTVQPEENEKAKLEMIERDEEDSIDDDEELRVST